MSSHFCYAQHHLPRCIGGLELGFDWRGNVGQAMASEVPLGCHHAIVVIAVEVSTVAGSTWVGQRGTVSDWDLAAWGTMMKTMPDWPLSAW